MSNVEQPRFKRHRVETYRLDGCGEIRPVACDPADLKGTPSEIDWTHEDQQAAYADGWGIFDNSDHGMQIERRDDASRFVDDVAAQAYVLRRATEGIGLACKAVVYLTYHHAVEDAAS